MRLSLRGSLKRRRIICSPDCAARHPKPALGINADFDCAPEETRNLEQQLDPWRDEDADEADESGRQTVIRYRLIYNAYSSDRNLTYASSLDRNDGDAPAERAWLGRG